MDLRMPLLGRTRASDSLNSTKWRNPRRCLTSRTTSSVSSESAAVPTSTRERSKCQETIITEVEEIIVEVDITTETTTTIITKEVRTTTKEAMEDTTTTAVEVVTGTLLVAGTITVTAINRMEVMTTIFLLMAVASITKEVRASMITSTIIVVHSSSSKGEAVVTTTVTEVIKTIRTAATGTATNILKEEVEASKI
jgi:hypothetical protein